VLSPVLLALIMIGAGTVAMAREVDGGLARPAGYVWLLILGGALLCLLAFMADALAALPNGIEAAYLARGGPFPWPIYLLGLVLVVAGLRVALRRPLSRPGVSPVWANNSPGGVAS
jgi:hypothetical protein